jgi:hypothetical protein
MDIEQGYTEEQREVSRIRLGLICAGILVIAALFAGLILVIGDMFSKKLWI